MNERCSPPLGANPNPHVVVTAGMVVTTGEVARHAYQRTPLDDLLLLVASPEELVKRDAIRVVTAMAQRGELCGAYVKHYL
jgi:hypothetical protein